MRRRELMGAGIGMLATSVRATTRVQQPDVEQIVAEMHDTSGLATGLSQSGDIVLFGFDDGNAMVYNDDHDGTVIPVAIDRSVSHIEVSDETTTAVLGWMDADVFAPLDLTTWDGTVVEHAGLWDLATTPDAGRTAAVSNPPAAPGSVRVADSDGMVLWDIPFGDATGQSVAISDTANHIAVGAGHYWADGTEPTGQPGIRLYDGTGSELWRHDHSENVISVGVDAERELVVAGTDDGHTIVRDLEGNGVWETAELGGWVVLSDDGGTLLTADDDGTLYAIESATGDVRWTADIGMWPAEDLSVSADGSRVFAADRGAAEFVVVDEGEPIWSESHDVGPGLGAIAADGGTWSTIVTDLEDESSLVEVYRAPDAVAEPDPAPTEDDPSDEEATSDEEDDSSNDDDRTGDPNALELVDYYILGEQASEEYITLQNTGDEPLDMSGWRLEDAHRIPAGNASPFPFPSGFTLAPGATVTIYTGMGETTDETLYWRYSGGFQIWNEEGDVVTIRDTSGTVVFKEPIEDNRLRDPEALKLVDYHILGEQASDEYITLRNTSDGPLEMSGWRLEDSHRIPAGNASPFSFPSGFTLAPGATVTIYTGMGEPTAETLYWGYEGDFQIWNEEGDVVIVRDANGTVVLEQRIAANHESNPPADDELDEPADPPDDIEPDEPIDSPGDNETDESDEPPSNNETNESPDPPDDEPNTEPDEPPGDTPDEPPDTPDEERNQPADPPADEPIDEPANPPDDADTTDSPDDSGGAQGDESNSTDAE